MTTLSASEVNVAIEACLDRTACLVPDVQVFEASDTWTKPAHARWIDFEIINRGQDGEPGGASSGGGGGASGCRVSACMPAELVPDTLTVTVQVTPTNNKVSGDSGHFEIECVQTNTLPSGATGGSVAARSPASYSQYSFDGANGGNGGAGDVPTGTNGANGDRGFTGVGGTGGTGGTYGTVYAKGGAGGRGYGAGGGGGGGGSGGGAGGGGGGAGGGGFGYAALATAGADGTTSGGAAGTGATGAVIITTWRGEVIV